MLQHVSLLGAFLSITSHAASAADQPPPVCPPGRYELSQDLEGSLAGAVPDSVVIELSDLPGARGGLMTRATRAGCTPGVVKMRATRSGTLVRVRFADCEGRGPVLLRGTIDPSCQRLDGQLRSQRANATISATQLGCGDHVAGYRDLSASLVIRDCPVSEGYEVNSRIADAPGTPALRVLSVYETRRDHSFNEHPRGSASVNVSEAGPIVLALVSYEPTDWTVTAAPGATIERVVLIGYAEPTAVVPDGVPVERYFHQGSSFDPFWGDGIGAYCGYSWPYNGGGCDTGALLDQLEKTTGLCVASFHGCYRATQFELSGTY